MSEKIDEVYNAEEQERLAEVAETFRYKDIDLSKFRKSDLIVVIGDLIEKVNEAMTTTSNATSVDQTEYDKLVEECDMLKAKLKQTTTIKSEPMGSMKYDEVISSFTSDDGYKSWN